MFASHDTDLFVSIDKHLLPSLCHSVELFLKGCDLGPQELDILLDAGYLGCSENI